MGRKPKAAKIAVATPEMANLESQPEIGNPSKERGDIQPIVNTDLSELALPKKKVGSYGNSAVRRSPRIQAVATPTHRQDIELVEEITLTENESIDEEHIDNLGELQKKSLEEVVGDLVDQMEAQKNLIDAYVSKVKSTFQCENPGAADVNYKQLYALCQKKLAALGDENANLRHKLELAQSKDEAYEKGTHVSSEFMGYLKDILISVVNLLQKGGEPEISVAAAAAAKRKRSI